MGILWRDPTPQERERSEIVDSLIQRRIPFLEANMEYATRTKIDCIARQSTSAELYNFQYLEPKLHLERTKLDKSSFFKKILYICLLPVVKGILPERSYFSKAL